MKTTAIILAAGKGIRFKTDIPKQFVRLAGKPVLIHTLLPFQLNERIDKIIIVTDREHLETVYDMIKEYKITKASKIIVGGDTRQESSRLGVLNCSDDTANILIHDAVRPFVDNDIINRCIDELNEHDAVCACIENADTILKINSSNDVDEIPNRKNLLRAQTPQAFRKDVISKAHEDALKSGITNATDDCSVVEKTKNARIHTVNGSEYNIKITTPLDMYTAERIFQIKPNTHTQITDVSKWAHDRVCVVFGGTSGIGKSIVEQLSEKGAVVIPMSRRNGVDVSKTLDVSKALNDIKSKYGRIDAVVIASAVMYNTPFEKLTHPHIQEEISTNLLGSINVAKEAIPHLKETHGKLVFFASSTYTRGRAGYTVYGATKAGIVNLMQGLAEEFSGQMDIIAINPQRTRTPLRESNFGKELDEKLLSPETVAMKTISAMASDITNCVIDVPLVDVSLN